MKCAPVNCEGELNIWAVIETMRMVMYKVCLFDTKCCLEDVVALKMFALKMREEK